MLIAMNYNRVLSSVRLYITLRVVLCGGDNIDDSAASFEIDTE